MNSNQSPLNEQEVMKTELKAIANKFKRNKEDKITKKLVLIFGSIIAICLGALLIISIVYFVPKLNQSNDSESLVNQGSSSTAKSVSEITINFPSFYDPKDPGGSFVNNPNQNNTSSKTVSETSSSTQLPSYNIDLQLVNSNYQRQTILSSQCNSKLNTLNGLVRFVPLNKNSPDTSLIIAHKRLLANQFETQQWQIATNFLDRETDFMSDGNTGLGPDYLQILRVGCNSSNITRVVELEVKQNLKFDKIRAWVTLNSPNNFPDISVHVYATLGDHVMIFTKNNKFDDFFRQEQFLACSDNNGIPKRDCLANTINTTDYLKIRLNSDLTDLLKQYELKETKKS